MNLEDNLGDIIRKARAMTNVSVADAAKAAGLTEAELTAIEDTGNVSKAPNYAALAQKIGLNAAKLEKIAKGWAPAEPDLGIWRELRRITTTKDFSVNAYLIWDEVSREAALFEKAYLILLFQEMIERGEPFIHVDTPGGYIEVDTQQDFEYARNFWLTRHKNK